jgi:hypothetical protein
MRILVCGSRYWDDGAAVHAGIFGLTALAGDDPDTIIIEGGARGADAEAASWARAFAPLLHERYPADWDTHGKAAGPIRNRRMLGRLLEGHPAEQRYVLAFKDGFDWTLKRGGTEHMVRIAKAAGVPTYVTSRA